MSLVILSRADTNEIGSLALNTLSELGKKRIEVPTCITQV